MTITIRVPKPDTVRRKVEESDDKSGRHYPIAGAWVDDLVELGKMVMLCALCKGKFNPKKRHYIKWSRMWLAIAKCDGCNVLDRNVQCYIPEADYTLLSPDYHPRKGRWASQ